MYVYLIMLLFSLVFAQLASNAKPYPGVKGSYYTFAILSFLPFALNGMLRWQVGTDWAIYDSYYYYINNGIKEFSEPLFNLLNKVLYQITTDSILLFAVVSFLTLFFFFKGMYQESVWIPFSILLFFLTGKYFTSLNQIRQMLAMGIFVYALKYLFQRKWIPYMICILAAGMIHISSLIYVPVYFLYGRNYRFRTVIKIAVIYCILYPIVRVLVVPVISLTRFSWYFESAYSDEGFYLMGFLVSFLILILYMTGLYRREWENRRITEELKQPLPLEEEEDFKKLGFMTVMSLAACLTLTLSAVIPQVSRISEGFAVVQIIGLPLLVSKEKDKRFRMLFMMYILLLYGFKLLYDVYINNWNTVLPYQSVFFR